MSTEFFFVSVRPCVCIMCVDLWALETPFETLVTEWIYMPSVNDVIYVQPGHVIKARRLETHLRTFPLFHYFITSYSPYAAVEKTNI